jgi:REP element-mobilizing transposase RayT
MLHPDAVKEIILHQMRRSLKRYHFRISYIEFVDNHFHIIVKTLIGGAAISEIMQYLKAHSAKVYNRTHGRIGPLWNERYKSEIIEDFPYPERVLMNLMVSLAYNPVRKGLFDNPDENPYSSIHIYSAGRNPRNIPILPHEYFLQLGPNQGAREKAFSEFRLNYLLSIKAPASL